MSGCRNELCPPWCLLVQEGGAAFPHVRQNGHLLLHRRLLLSLVGDRGHTHSVSITPPRPPAPPGSDSECPAVPRQVDAEGAGPLDVPHALADLGHGRCGIHVRLLLPREVTRPAFVSRLRVPPSRPSFVSLCVPGVRPLT